MVEKLLKMLMSSLLKRFMDKMKYAGPDKAVRIKKILNSNGAICSPSEWSNLILSDISGKKELMSKNKLNSIKGIK